MLRRILIKTLKLFGIGLVGALLSAVAIVPLELLMGEEPHWYSPACGGVGFLICYLCYQYMPFLQ